MQMSDLTMSMFLRKEDCAEAKGWQPIETAPRDGTRILINRPPCSKNGFREGRDPIVAYWCDGEFVGEGGGWLATLWHPLPDLPK